MRFRGNGIPIPMGIPWKWNTDMPKMGMEMGRVHVTMGMGMANFCTCAKIPIGRLDANAIQYKNSSGDEIANVLVNDDIAHT